MTQCGSLIQLPFIQGPATLVTYFPPPQQFPHKPLTEGRSWGRGKPHIIHSRDGKDDACCLEIICTRQIQFQLGVAGVRTVIYN